LSGYLSLADGRLVPVRDGLVIGRIADCDLHIDDHKASRRHAKLVVEAGVVEIEDLGSSNGTLLNGKPVTRRVLRPGDEIQIGKTVLTYRDAPLPGTAPGAAPGKAAASPVADDNDLFGGDEPAPPPPVAAPVRPATAPAASAPPPPAPAAPPPRPAVVEFADEVVEVRKPAAAPGGAPGKAQPAPAEPAVAKQRILQFSKQAEPSGVLGDDVGQMSSGTRALVFAVVLAVALGIAYLVVQFVR
jgi:predicted component of type VI protein secretion system